jgi:hypothetical protein
MTEQERQKVIKMIARDALNELRENMTKLNAIVERVDIEDRVIHWGHINDLSYAAAKVADAVRWLSTQDEPDDDFDDDSDFDFQVGE